MSELTPIELETALDRVLRGDQGAAQRIIDHNKALSWRLSYQKLYSEQYMQLATARAEVQALDLKPAQKEIHWTTDQPTVEGWYWSRTQAGPSASLVTIYQVYNFHDGSELMAGHEELMPVSKIGGEWAGPIPPP